MKFVYFHIMIVSIAFFSCSTAPEFERNNPNDSGSEDFIPDTPSRRVITASVDNNLNLIFNWQKDSLDIGFIVSKKIRPNEQFTVLDTVSENLQTYIDSTKIWTINTIYQFNFFRVLEDNSVINNPDPSIVRIEVEPFQYFGLQREADYYDVKSEYDITLVTAYAEESSPSQIRITTGFEIQQGYINSVDSLNWRHVEDIPYDPTSNGNYFITPDFNVLNLHIRVFQYFEDFKRDRYYISELSYTDILSHLQDFKYTLIDELTGELSWRFTPSVPADFRISGASFDTTLQQEIPAQSDYSIIIRQNTDSIRIPHQYTIRPFVGQDKGKAVSTGKYYPNVPTPSILSVNHLNTNDIGLFWQNHPDNSDFAGFIIDLIPFHDSTSPKRFIVGKDVNSYRLTGLDPSNTHTINLKSYTSPSDHVDIKFGTIFSQFSSEALGYPGFNVSFSKTNKYQSKFIRRNFGNYEYEHIHVRNNLNNRVYGLELPRGARDWGAKFTRKVVSETHDLLVFHWTRDEVDVGLNYMSIYNFVDDAYVAQNIPIPNHTLSRLELGDDDKSVLYLVNNDIVVYDLVQNNISRTIQIKTDQSSWPIIKAVRGHNSFLTCSLDGISQYSIDTGDLLNQVSYPCRSMNLSDDSDLITFFHSNEIFKLSLSTFQITPLLTSDIDVPGSGARHGAYWYFDQDDLLIYPTLEGYSGLFTKTGEKFSFKILNIHRDGLSNIQNMRRNNAGTFSIITNDANTQYRFDQGWSVISE